MEQAYPFDFRRLPRLRGDGRVQHTEGEGNDKCYGAQPHVGLPNKNLCSQITSRSIGM